MRKNPEMVFSGRGKPSKLLLHAKLKFLLLLCAIMPHVAYAYSQAGTVSLDLKNATLEEVIWEIQKKTDFVFMYVTSDLEGVGRITVKEVDKPLADVLKSCLRNTGLKYQIKENAVIISRAQQPSARKISGVVKDEKGMPLPGATVVVKGTTIGTATDVQGRYTLTIPGGTDQIVSFSFTGMVPQEVKITDATTYNVSLKEDVVALKDVVVTGYFTQSQESFTGTATTFTGEELRQVNPVNMLTALSVLDPSFKMVENNIDGSNPNVVPQFEVRGSASMPNVKNEYEGNPNMPTFILDGFEVSAEKVFDMDPNRIESMTLLKDAAATAVYGSRASNGVVVITSKMPEKGTLRLNYNLDMSFNLPDLRDYDLLNAAEKLELERQAGFYYSIVPNLMEEREAQYNYKLNMVEKGYDTYWLNKPLQVAIGHKHTLSVEGGENALRYSMDIFYENAPGVMRESNRERMGLSVLLQYQLKNITFKNQIAYDVVNSRNSPYGSFGTYARANPYYAYEDEDGNLLYLLEDDKRGAFENVPNPLYNTQLHTIDKSSYGNFTNNFSLDWRITDDLRLKANVAVFQKKEEGVVFKPAKHTDFNKYSDQDYYRKGLYRSTEGKDWGYDLNVVLSYFKQWGDHSLSANAALNMQERTGDKYSVTVEGFPDENLDYITFGAQYHKYNKPAGNDNISRLIGYVGNINYSLKERYLLDLSVRADASSKFGKDTRWAPFGSVGIGWNIHNEEFIRQNLSFINRLKIRASIGWTGSQSFDPFQAIPKYEYNVTDRYRYGIGASMKGIANRNLKWQKTLQRNLGLDLDIFKRRLMISFNLYRNSSKNLLSDITLPPSLGFRTYMENIGEIENRGLDLKLRGTVLRTEDAYLNLSVGIVRNRNKLLKISNSLKAWNESQDGEVSNKPRVRFIEGQSLNTIWGVPSLGINPANGQEIFVDRNGKRTDKWDSRDQRPIGCKDSDIEGNISISGGYKGFQVSMYMSYRLGGEMYNSTLVDRVENADKRYNCDSRVLNERWRKEGDITFYKSITDGTTTQATSRFVQKYSYLQMSSLNVSYDFPQEWLKHIAVRNLRLSFYMNDVFRWSSVKSERGLDYPFAHSFRTSLRFSF